MECTGYLSSVLHKGFSGCLGMEGKRCGGSVKWGFGVTPVGTALSWWCQRSNTSHRDPLLGC